MIHSFNKIFTEHLLHARDTTLRKTDKVLVPKELIFLSRTQWPKLRSTHILGNARTIKKIKQAVATRGQISG